jgi:hypothetical protein
VIKSYRSTTYLASSYGGRVAEVAAGLAPTRRAGGLSGASGGWEAAGQTRVVYKAFISYSHAVDGKLAPGGATQARASVHVDGLVA